MHRMGSSSESGFRSCYRTANWIHLGQTLGRGKLDTRHQCSPPVKQIFGKPLWLDWKAIFHR